MIQLSYLAGLFIALTGLLLLDWRYQLVFWHDVKRACRVLGIGYIVFFIWDIIGIRFGIFHHGSSDYAMPFTILPHFPVEELFFIAVLCYCPLILYSGACRWLRISL